jgi:hypothetical protein
MRLVNYSIEETATYPSTSSFSAPFPVDQGQGPLPDRTQQSQNRAIPKTINGIEITHYVDHPARGVACAPSIGITPFPLPPQLSPDKVTPTSTSLRVATTNKHKLHHKPKY